MRECFQFISSALEKRFHIRAHNSTIKTEILAGVTTFVAISYILFVNPTILAAAGIPKEAAIAATIWASICATSLMGLWANFPVAVAPGMGLNAFFSYTVVLGMGLPWQTALGGVFISGIIFLLLTLGGIREAIINAVPMNLKCAIGVGLGLFIAFVGLQNAGIVVSNPATLISAGHVGSIHFELGKPAPLLALAGLLATCAFMAWNLKSALLLGIVFTTLLGMVCGAAPYPTSFSSVASLELPSLADTFMAMDIMAALQYGVIAIIFTFTVVELFDNMGVLIGVSRKAGLMAEDGSIKNLNRALTSDALGTMASAMLGTSTVTAYVESAAGAAAGGRTGLTALTVAALFALALFFAPLMALVPAFATAPALIVVGCLMTAEVTHVRFDDITDALPAFLTIIMMPLTYSVANGFAFGFISYTGLKVLAGRYKEVGWGMGGISLVFMVNFVLRLS